ASTALPVHPSPEQGLGHARRYAKVRAILTEGDPSMKMLLARATLLAALAVPATSALANTSELDGHLNCAAVFIQVAQMTSGDVSAGWGEYAVQVMSLASDMSSVEAVQG